MSMGEGCNLVYLRQGRQCITWCSRLSQPPPPSSENPGHAPVGVEVGMGVPQRHDATDDTLLSFVIV